MRASLMEPTGVERKALEQLKLRLRGPLIVPGEPGYDEARSVWNAMIDRRPMAIVRCLGVADVIACVDLAREHGIIPCIKGGGHNFLGADEGEGRLRAAYGGNYDRLAKVKRAWDPENLFRANKNIVPA